MRLTATSIFFGVAWAEQQELHIGSAKIPIANSEMSVIQSYNNYASGRSAIDFESMDLYSISKVTRYYELDRAVYPIEYSTTLSLADITLRKSGSSDGEKYPWYKVILSWRTTLSILAIEESIKEITSK
jgi:hypothetical protein